ncbi:MAG: FtsW/RodA/SpoVE family cell cycle protein [Prevotella sp.]|jgi:cell division protein FtsW|nr:FtsW/RodA/SpoVE family cell cycle protein [Prevotella sp.]
MKISISNIFKGDKVIWMIFFFLCVISLIEVFSSSSTLTFNKSNYWGPIIKHGGILLLGVALMVVVQNIDCKYFKIATIFLIIFSAATLLWVLVAGQTTNGAQRWMSILGIQFQPSEIAKGTIVLAVAQILSAMQTEDGTEEKTFKYILYVACPLMILIMFENLSTAVLIGVVVIGMMFYGRVSLIKVGRLIGLLTIAVIFLLALILLFGQEEEPKENDKNNLTEQVVTANPEKPANENFLQKMFHRAGTWKGRIKKFVSGQEITPEEFDLNVDSQVGYSNIAIASSGFLGKGPGNSEMRDLLPQAFSDFIYAIIIEELGLAGGIFVMFLYIFLLWRAGRIADRCANNFPAFLVMGLALLLVVQAMFNMMVAVGLAPVTGQPLPLISKGGTSTIINCIYIGAILSVSISAKRKKKNSLATEPATTA